MPKFVVTYQFYNKDVLVEAENEEEAETKARMDVPEGVKIFKTNTQEYNDWEPTCPN